MSKIKLTIIIVAVFSAIVTAIPHTTSANYMLCDNEDEWIGLQLNYTCSISSDKNDYHVHL